MWRSISGRVRLSSQGMNRSAATAEIAANATMKFDPEPVVDLSTVQHHFGVKPERLRQE